MITKWLCPPSIFSDVESATIFRFAHSYATHMVLQKGAQGASIWGFSSAAAGDTVKLYLNDKLAATTTVHSHTANAGLWQTKVIVTQNFNTAYTLTASSSLGLYIDITTYLVL